MSRKIILDTDPGIDDAMAIFYALHSPELDVIGLTTIFGNAATPTCTRNALRLLEISGRADIPVSAGAQRPFVMPFRGGADFVHGADGQGNSNLPPPHQQPTGKRAADFIIEEALKAPGEVTLVALGPLTNLALAFLMEPHLPENLREIVLMGGNAFCSGNITPAAEANIFNDPEAADVVFGVNCPITMCGLDVTEKTVMSAALLDSIAAIDSLQARHLAKILPFYRAFYRQRYGEDAIHVHDSTTISYLLAPSLYRTVQHPVRVDTTMGIGRGKTWVALGHSDQESAWQGRRKINICVQVDAAKVIQMELERLAR